MDISIRITVYNIKIQEEEKTKQNKRRAKKKYKSKIE